MFNNFKTKILGIDHRHRQPLAAGENHVEWTVRIPRPQLWWPHELGAQPLVDAEFTLATEARLVTCRKKNIGFRAIQDSHQWFINGGKIFLRGSNIDSLDRNLAEITYESALANIQRY